MDTQRESIRTSNFRNYYFLEQGIKVTVPISKFMLELNRLIKNLAHGKLASYHVHEDSLYESIKSELGYFLPDSDLVLIKNPYPKMKPRRETDISIRNMSNLDEDRSSGEINCSHFIEIKSIFHNEKLPQKDIDDDLDKLSDATKMYGAIGIFIIVGLNHDLNRRKRSLAKLGKLGEEFLPFSVTTYTGKEVWLLPAGSYTTDDPNVYVWEVSYQNDFHKRKSSFEFAAFQYK
ncbi:hypothetical protein [Vibrio harveyi]|uniref:hypothetical protein n=1 Tax=Vibrio harveyi TaxID=669 RepID=UPI0024B82733|nr:hypothetical protein [Vibrio harveyi]EKO3818262.1 hypothetical protein [Vibrio harveyi]WHP63955.1 hypothetical protein QMY49_05305 [Vibrio harveyi]